MFLFFREMKTMNVLRPTAVLVLLSLICYVAVAQEVRLLTTNIMSIFIIKYSYQPLFSVQNDQIIFAWPVQKWKRFSATQNANRQNVTNADLSLAKF